MILSVSCNGLINHFHSIMDYSIQIDTIRMELSILFLRVRESKFKICFILANRATDRCI